MTPEIPLLPYPLKPLDGGLYLSDQEYKISSGPGELDFCLALARRTPVTFTVGQPGTCKIEWNCRILSFTDYGEYWRGNRNSLIGVAVLTPELPEFYEGQYHPHSRKGVIRRIENGEPFWRIITVDGARYLVKPLFTGGIYYPRSYQITDLQTGKTYNYELGEALFYHIFLCDGDREQYIKEQGLVGPKFEDGQHIYQGAGWVITDQTSGSPMRRDPGIPFAQILEQLQQKE